MVTVAPRFKVGHAGLPTLLGTKSIEWSFSAGTDVSLLPIHFPADVEAVVCQSLCVVDLGEDVGFGKPADKTTIEFKFARCAPPSGFELRTVCR